MLKNELLPLEKNIDNEFSFQEKGIVESTINKSKFKYQIFLKEKPRENNIFHLTDKFLGDKVELMPKQVDDGDIDWDQIPYEYWEDAPYSPYTPRKKTVVVCFAPTPQQALLAIAKFKENMPKEKGKYYIYTADKKEIPDLTETDIRSVHDSIDTEELRTKEPVKAKFIGYIEYEAMEFKSQ